MNLYDITLKRFVDADAARPTTYNNWVGQDGRYAIVERAARSIADLYWHLIPSEAL